MGVAEKPDIADLPSGSGTVVVTGAASGIGKAVAERFAGRARILVDRDPNRIVGNDGDVVIGGDISDPRTASEIARAVEGAGGLAAAVHAAGIGTSPAPPQDILRINLLGSHLVERALRPFALPNSALVLIASIAAYMNAIHDRTDLVDAPLGEGALAALSDGLTPLEAYSLSKFGMHRLAERSAASWGEKGARILSLSPGLVDTPMMPPPGERDPGVDLMLAMSPLKRMADAREIASVAFFLCSAQASFVSGCDVRVDGGVVAQMHNQPG